MKSSAETKAYICRMNNAFKNQKNILEKLNIQQLNPMQKEAHQAIQSDSDLVLLSPTGTGKTLAYLLPIVDALNEECTEVQALILVPSRELAIQIEQVAREMGSGFKVNSVYGGRAGSQDKIDLKHRPAILIGTPGRIADHLRKESFQTGDIRTLVLDEFDKSLEVGFEGDMTEICEALGSVQKRILTSATKRLKPPKFVGLQNPITVNYLHEKIELLKVRMIVSPTENKLRTLQRALTHIGNKPGIIFCNLKESIYDISDFLFDRDISHGCFHGGMEQIDRERALIKFRNGTHQLLIATDLAARGIDVPEIRFIIHYELPPRLTEFTHRNGRTARMNSDGTAYILQWKELELPEFIPQPEIEELQKAPRLEESKWKTLYITGGRRDKISKGDIAGLFLKQGQLTKDALGIIEIKQDCAFVAVDATKVNSVLELVNNKKLKTKKVRISEV